MNVIEQARVASARLVRALGAEPGQVVAPAAPRPRGLLDAARRLAEANDRAWDVRLQEEERPYWEADVHDATYWRRELGDKVSEETLAKLLRSLGLE